MANIDSVSKETTENYYEADQNIDDSLSDASDCSFHSICQDMKDCSVEDSLIRSSLSQDNTSTNHNSKDDCSFSDNICVGNDSKVSNEPSLEKLVSTIGELVTEASNGNTDSTSTAPPIIENAEEDATDSNIKPLSDEDFNICCLDSVKTKDEEWELKVKDRDTDLDAEELKSAVTTAVAEKKAGNLAFTDGRYTDAIKLYNTGLGQCPLSAPHDRAMLYHNRAVAYVKMEEAKLGVHSLDLGIQLWPEYLKAIVRRAGLHEQLGDLDDALKDYKTVLELSPGHTEARQATLRLPPIIEERNEKLKAEMMGKLKDLGNMVLRPFGLSTNNFQLQQDEKTGGYNIQFNQKPQ